jgi:hypothetical protein
MVVVVVVVVVVVTVVAVVAVVAVPREGRCVVLQGLLCSHQRAPTWQRGCFARRAF